SAQSIHIRRHPSGQDGMSIVSTEQEVGAHVSKAQSKGRELFYEVATVLIM
ncbi:hypothetical protein E4U59_003766, partial [Claviceps monticola]